MQACPYDALYIDPETNTAAKCNYCSHRTDIGLEPACVNVCPEHAIISGDMEDPNSEISKLIAGQQVQTRKPEKGTKPNVYYINGDEASLNPSATERSNSYIWGSQSTGVGHFSKYAERLTEGKDLIEMIQDLNGSKPSSKEATYGGSDERKRQVEVIMGSANAKRVYDTPDKGVLWGWEVSAYVLTKAISAGIFLVLALGKLFGLYFHESTAMGVGIVSLVFLLLTGILLIMDLDRPDRFIYVLLRPHWGSWLVRGGYSITIFGGMVTTWLVGIYFDIQLLEEIGFWMGFLSAILVAIYTAFLFAQAKGRDFWQSPSMVFHMFIHSLMAGSASVIFLNLFDPVGTEFITLARNIMMMSIIANVVVMMIEVSITHPTDDAKTAVRMIVNGRYASLFWGVVIVLTNIVPLGLLYGGGDSLMALSGLLVVIGIYVTEKIWVEAPQRISLT